MGGKKKTPHHKQQLKMAFKLKKYTAQNNSSFVIPRPCFYKNLVFFFLPLLSSEEKNVPPLSKKDECVAEQLRCERQWCLFVFVSPLEPSLPWELCRPGNKQSFVSTDPLCPAARLQTFTPALIGNRRREVGGSWRKGASLTSTCAFIIAHQNKRRQTGCCDAPVTTKSKASPPTPIRWLPTPGAFHLWETLADDLLFGTHGC